MLIKPIQMKRFLSEIKTKWIAGVDEAGRGAWAGPLAVAMVIRPTIEAISELAQSSLELNFQDSKQLSSDQREVLYPQISESASWTKFQFASLKDIEILNINGATLKALKKLISVIPAEIKKDVTIFLDGRFKFNIGLPFFSLVNGDTRLKVIAEASILAKVGRDRFMCRMDKKFAGYGFSQHKGYGTLMHRKELEKRGVSSFHRKKYRPIAELLAQNSSRG
jgi:ribonuclease HII